MINITVAGTNAHICEIQVRQLTYMHKPPSANIKIYELSVHYLLAPWQANTFIKTHIKTRIKTNPTYVLKVAHGTMLMARKGMPGERRWYYSL